MSETGQSESSLASEHLVYYRSALTKTESLSARQQVLTSENLLRKIKRVQNQIGCSVAYQNVDDQPLEHAQRKKFSSYSVLNS